MSVVTYDYTDITQCCIVDYMLIDTQQINDIGTVFKTALWYPEQPKEEVSNLYGEALFSGKLHQHTLKNPNGTNGAGTCNYWSVYSHKAISTGCPTVLQICYYFQRTADCIVSTGKDVDKISISQ